MMARENILQRVRAALGRLEGGTTPRISAARLPFQGRDLEVRIRQFSQALEKLAGKVYRAGSRTDVCAYASDLLRDKSAVASNASFLKECGVVALDGVQTHFYDEDQLRKLCVTADVGITGADYALADTGTLVMISSAEEARMISLLPPTHLAIISCDKILSGLEELFSLLPQPSQRSSSAVFITGPSRTADIEQILVRGVHGPGELHVVIV